MVWKGPLFGCGGLVLDRPSLVVDHQIYWSSMVFTSFKLCSFDIVAQVCLIFAVSSAFIFGFIAETFWPIICQKLSIVFRSGLCTGHSMMLTFLSCIQTLTSLAGHHHRRFSGNNTSALGSIFLLRVEIYFSPFMISWHSSRNPTPEPAMYPHTMTETRCFSVGRCILVTTPHHAVFSQMNSQYECLHQTLT